MTQTQPQLTSNIPAAVIAHCAGKLELSATASQDLAREVEKFLTLCAMSVCPRVPSPAVDAFWHEFILNTVEYEKFCKVNFSLFVHHQPRQPSDQPSVALYIETIRALEEVFGEVNGEIWPSSDGFLREVCDSIRFCKDK